MTERHGPRIVVIGNCQAVGTAQALRLLLPDARVETQPIAYLKRRFRDLGGFARHLRDADHVFSHFFPDGFLPGGNVLALQKQVPHLRLFPTIVFPAFHPDVVYVGDVAGLRLSKLVQGPVGPSHSAIALCAFLEGLSVEAALGLYSGAVFERLGYDRAWDEGAAYLLKSARDMQFGLEPELARWSRRGCFMHDANHPKLPVLGDIARRLAVEAALRPLDLRVEDYLPDALVDESMWPVYPEIAERYGVPAEFLFRARPVRGGPPRLLDLPAFIAESFAVYARVPRERLTAARVTAWRSDPEIRALFTSAGGA
ncbi:WcbI family polysaccharide biosynthesis putative acetyltransferase [Methylobacterium haplocladii]|uniref:Polysaccharide biosynthesis enzyme WcbI domain-containing protein n=1 Tax=Methylobacterium haplocladii TaxID=1176176 RepID=A0A512IRL8_9HYPH|nr:WcbI family polysaccharide biosynthesis putative acetyltransferase [Methylobacterium haplocladii]GEP00326.1 hypothetical protein MHA02_27130 [Methylobacterium haplocladii]GJD86097.1 hypothetical protein HPGCJGGD_3994 [Methylobacterium haplocladii]GLS61036.1 hypothetical protein GCM10007887_37290 [Methylobacterium haplocladii]